MADDQSVTDDIFEFEKPLLIEDKNCIPSVKVSLPPDSAEPGRKQTMATDDTRYMDELKAFLDSHNRMSFKQYLELCETYSTISFSHIHQIVKKIQVLRQQNGKSDPDEIERWLKKLDTPDRPKNFSGLLKDGCFRDEQNKLCIDRIVTLFELLTIKKGEST